MLLSSLDFEASKLVALGSDKCVAYLQAQVPVMRDIIAAGPSRGLVHQVAPRTELVDISLRSGASLSVVMPRLWEEPLFLFFIEEQKGYMATAGTRESWLQEEGTSLVTDTHCPSP